MKRNNNHDNNDDDDQYKDEYNDRRESAQEEQNPKARFGRTKNETSADDDEEGRPGSGGLLKMAERDAEIVYHSLIVLLPHPEPITWYMFLFLFVIVSIPGVVYIILFTKLGFGEWTFNALSTYNEKYNLSNWMALGIFCVVYFFYLIDLQHWKTWYGRTLQTLLGLALLTAVNSLVLVVVGEYPYGPLFLFAGITTAWLVIVHNILFAKTDTRTYITWLGGPLLTAFLVILTVWIVYISRSENKLNDWTKIMISNSTGCQPDFENFPLCKDPDVDSKFPDQLCFYGVKTDETWEAVFADNTQIDCETRECLKNVYESCTNVFILHSGPMFVSLIYLFLGFTTTFLRTDHSHETEMYAFLKFWAVLLVGLWVTTCISGANGSIAIVFGVLTIAGFLGSGMMLLAVMSTERMKAKIEEEWHILEHNYGGYFDYARGALVLMCAPLLLFVVYTSVLKQSLRKINLPCETRPTTDDWVTEETAHHLQGFYSWSRVKVYKNGIYLGMVINIIVLFMKFTNLLLAWIISLLQDSNVFLVTIILITICVFMLFLLPPCPGPPIYMLFGIVIIPVAVNKGTMNVPVAVLYASVASLITKLVGCALQQKCIGEPFSNNLTVRQIVAVNSPIMRAFRLILTEKGMSIGKTAILMGGPDWPTSVYTGFLRLPLYSTMTGTLPIFPFLICPTVLMGSLLYMRKETTKEGALKYEWAGTACMFITAIVAINSTALALLVGYYAEKTLHLRKDEVDAIPIDKEIEELDEELRKFEIVYKKVTHWSRIPAWAKFFINFSLASMTVSVYLINAFSKRCFEPFEITDSIETKLDGRALSMVKPLGWIAMIFILNSYVFLSIVTRWATNQAKLEDAKSNVERGLST